MEIIIGTNKMIDNLALKVTTTPSEHSPLTGAFFFSFFLFEWQIGIQVYK